MQLKTGLGIFTAIVLLSSIIVINTSSFAQTNSESKSDYRDKIDKPFRDKIDKMVQTGEKGYHRVIIFVKKVAVAYSEGHKFDATKNKDSLEASLLENHSAKNVYKAKVLSFVSAEVPIEQIDKIAAYDYVDQIGDEELEVEPLSLVERSDGDPFLSNHPNKALPVETNLNVAKQAVNSPTTGPTGTGVIVALNEATGAIDAEADFVVMNTDGFTINWIDAPAAADKIYFLALKGGTYDVGSFTKTTAPAPVSQNITGLGFKPKGLILTSFNDIGATTVQSHNRLSFGSSDGTNQGSTWSGDSDNVADSITARSEITTKTIRLASEAASGGSSTINAEASLQSFDLDGFTLNWTTNDSVARQIVYVAFANSTFGTIVNLSKTSIRSNVDGVASVGNNMYVVWTDDVVNPTPQPGEILFRRSTDNGNTFDSTVNVSNNAGSSCCAEMVVFDNKIYLAWTDNTPGNNDVFFRRSTDNGATFDPVINLSNNAGNSIISRIATSGNSVYVVWSDNSAGTNQLLFRRSTNNGTTFDSAITLDSTSAGSIIARITAAGNNVYVLIENPSNSDILFTRSTNGGATFDLLINLSNNAGFSQRQAIAVFGNNVYAVWSDRTPGNDDVFFRRSIDNGATFDPVINLSNNAGAARDPSIDAFGNDVYVVWEEGSGADETFFRRSTDNGATFDPVINLSNNGGETNDAKVDVSGNSVYAVWSDSSPGSFDIFFRKSADKGVTFGTTVNVSNNSGLSGSGSGLVGGLHIGVSASRVYLSWSDDSLDPVTSNNVEVFFTWGSR